jgi:hypothetical protein
MNRIKLIAALLLAATFAFAQTAPPTDIATIQQNFKKLDVLGSVLYVAAHPDDENTRLLPHRLPFNDTWRWWAKPFRQ